jgi:hypothetical protein
MNLTQEAANTIMHRKNENRQNQNTAYWRGVANL